MIKERCMRTIVKRYSNSAKTIVERGRNDVRKIVERIGTV